MRNLIISAVAFTFGSLFVAFLGPVSSIFVERWIGQRERPTVMVLAPLVRATVSQLDRDGIVVASKPHPIDQLVYLAVKNDTPNVLKKC